MNRKIKRLEKNGSKKSTRKEILENLLVEIYGASGVQFNNQKDISVGSSFFNQPIKDETKEKHYFDLFELTFCSELTTFCNINGKPFSRKHAVRNAVRYFKINNIKIPEVFSDRTLEKELCCFIYETLRVYIIPTIFEISQDEKEKETEWGSTNITEEFNQACNIASFNSYRVQARYTPLYSQNSFLEIVYDSNCLKTKCKHGLLVKVKSKLPKVIWYEPDYVVWKKQNDDKNINYSEANIQTYEEIIEKLIALDETESLDRRTLSGCNSHNDNSDLPSLVASYPISDKIVSISPFFDYDFFYFTDLSPEKWKKDFHMVKNLSDLDLKLNRRIKEIIEKKYTDNLCVYYKEIINNIEDVLDRVLSELLTLKRLINRSNKSIKICMQILEGFNLDSKKIIFDLKFLDSRQEVISEAYNLIENAIFLFARQLNSKGKVMACEMRKYLDDREIRIHKGKIFDAINSTLLSEAIKMQAIDYVSNPEQYVDKIKNIYDSHRYSKLFEYLKQTLEEYYQYLSEPLDIDENSSHSKCVECSKCQKCSECPSCPQFFETFFKKSDSTPDSEVECLGIIPITPSN